MSQSVVFLKRKTKVPESQTYELLTPRVCQNYLAKCALFILPGIFASKLNVELLGMVKLACLCVSHKDSLLTRLKASISVAVIISFPEDFIVGLDSCLDVLFFF